MSNVGYRINPKVERPNRELVDMFTGIPVSNIGDNMGRIFCLDARIRPMNSAPLLGTALTVKTRSGDNLLIHKAIDMAEPGDVVIVDAQGVCNHALVGELMALWAQTRGVAGIIIDGAVRDLGILKNLPLPIYAAGITPAGPFMNGPGEINHPITCGGVVVKPGDIIVGDEDGVVVIDPNDAIRVLEKAKETAARETNILEAIKKKTWDRSWVDKALQEKGCEYVE